MDPSASVDCRVLRIEPNRYPQLGGYVVLGLSLGTSETGSGLATGPLEMLMNSLVGSRQSLLHVGATCAAEDRMSSLVRSCSVSPDFGKFVVYTINDPSRSPTGVREQRARLIAPNEESIRACVRKCAFEEAFGLYTATMSATELLRVIESALARFAARVGAKQNSDVTEEWMESLAQSGVSTFLVVDDGNGLLCQGPEDGFFEHLLTSVMTVVTRIESTDWYKDNMGKLAWDNDAFCMQVVKT